MDIKLLVEIFVALLIIYRVYILQKFNIKSAADKLFALYYLRNHYPLLAAVIIFYIFEIVFVEFIVWLISCNSFIVMNLFYKLISKII